MSKTTPEQNKALVIEAFDTLFNKRDYDAAGGVSNRFRHRCGGAEGQILTDEIIALLPVRLVH